MSASTSLAPLQSTPFQTVITSRSPRQKVHRSLSHAKNAVTYRVPYYGRGTDGDAAIYEWRDGAWTLLWEIPKGTRYNDLPWNRKEPTE